MPLFAGKKIKMDQQQNMELTKDQIIQELIALLNQNQKREAANNVFEMAALIDGMEKRLESVTEELVNVRMKEHKDYFKDNPIIISTYEAFSEIVNSLT